MLSVKFNRFDFLDSLRGLAAYSVVLEHSKLFFENFDWLTDGVFFGLVVFFVLSSFLLTYRLIIQYEAANYSTLAIVKVTLSYFVMRFFRIYLTLVAFGVIHAALQFAIYPYDDALAMKPGMCLEGILTLVSDFFPILVRLTLFNHAMLTRL
jgi:peptidoglycan/LPS O-acetylase OafA/YrhL